MKLKREPDEYLSHDVELICDIKRNRLQVWLQNGYIRPSKKVAEGSGSNNVYSFGDLCAITLFKKIVDEGLSRASTAIFMPYLYANIGNLEKAVEEKNGFIFLYRTRGNATEFSIGEFHPKHLEAGDDVIGINYAKIIAQVSCQRDALI